MTVIEKKEKHLPLTERLTKAEELKDKCKTGEISEEEFKLGVNALNLPQDGICL